MQHLFIWHRATRGDKIQLERSIAKNTRKGKNVAVWSKSFGYLSRDASDINTLINRIVAAEPTYTDYFSGQRIVANTQTGPLRQYYNDLHELVGHGLATPSQVQRYKPRIDTVIKLLYFEKVVKKKFMATHNDAIRRGYNALNLAMPDDTAKNRKACLDEIGKFVQTAANNRSGDVTRASELLVRGLKNLEEAYVPVRWV